MNLFPVCQTVLYTISTALLYPVVLVLLLLCLWMLVYAGGFAAEWVKRRRFKKSDCIGDAMEIIHLHNQLPRDLAAGLPLHVAAFAEQLSHLIPASGRFASERIESLNQSTSAHLLNDVDKIRLIVRTGPSLGLMGTLIPMGTGLAGLSQGNMAQLSSSLILAFTTTVVGLALGIAAHMFSVIKEQWVMADIRQINLITEAMAAERVQTAKEVKAA